MNIDLLFSNFQLLNTPEKIQKLKQAILQLAVQGKLVPQDPKDEPASELVKTIKSEKAKLIRERKLKKEKLPPPISEDETPYELPNGWEWVRILSLFNSISIKGKQIKSSNYRIEGKFPIISQSQEFISGYSNDVDKLIKIENPVIVFGDHTKEVKYIDFNFIAGADGTKVLNPHKGIFERYFYYVVRSYDLEARGYARHFKILSNQLFPLPPLAEQKRIVEKVGELFSRADEIESSLKKADEEIVHLNKSALNQLLESKAEEEFRKYFEFIVENFDLLYSDERNVKELRQSILQLAVHGKLVPQDPTDEPASELLKRIKAEKERLIREGKINREKPLPPISEDEIPYELSEGWVWVRLGEICETITKGSSPKWQGINYVGEGQGVLFITSKNVGQYKLIMGELSYVDSKFNEIEPRSLLQNGDILMNIVGASIGRTALYTLNEIANINQAVCLIRLLKVDCINKEYFLHFFNSSICIGYMFDKQVDNARANLSMGNIAKFLIPIPPLNEQKRIIKKVDELMKLCDGLESKILQSKEASERLMGAILQDVFKH